MKNIIFILIAVSFCKIFLIYNIQNWGDNFSNMEVPANSWPGGDSRNIQLASFCSKKGYDIYTENSCNTEEVLAKGNYPEAKNPPPYNYPSIWVKIYNIFDSTEESFKVFWYINALCVFFTIFLLALKYNKDYLFLVLFSPITLLTIERGNVDGIVFSLVVFFSFFLIRFPFVSSFFLTISSALKLYPIVLLPILFIQKTKNKILFLFGFLFGLLFLIKTVFEVKYILHGTPIGFGWSYGFLTLKSFSLFRDFDIYFRLSIIFSLIIFAFYIILFLIRRKVFDNDLNLFIKNSKSEDINIIFACLLIYCLTFLFFGNWAYRYIFIIPILLIVSKQKSNIFLLIKVNAIFILWSGFLPHKIGPIFINLFGYPMFIFFSCFIYFLVKNNIYYKSFCEKLLKKYKN